MPYLLFLNKQQNMKLSSAANYRWRFIWLERCSVCTTELSNGINAFQNAYAENSNLSPFPVIHKTSRLLSYMLVVSDSLNCKQYEPISDCSHRSSLIRVYSVCFHGKSIL